MKSRMQIAAVVMALLAAPVARSAETERWQVQSFDQWSKGKASGVEIGSAGELKPVMVLDSATVGADGIWTMAAGGGGVYLGTGNSGKLFLQAGGRVKQIAQVGQVAITRIRMDREGRAVFSAIPGGVIYRLTKQNQVEKLAEAGEEYVWDFIFDGPDIIAATGPRGKIVRLGPDGKVKSVIETAEQHVMCLTRAGNGKLYAGTAGEGLVLEIGADGKYRVAHDFDEKEVRRLVWAGDLKTGVLLAAVNDEAGARPSTGPSGAAWGRPRTDKEEDEDKDGDPDSGDKDKKEPAVAILPRGPAPRAGGKVTGTVYALTAAGGARELVKLPNRAAVDMVAAGPDVYVATDQEGKVYRLRPDSTDYAIAFDLHEAQALSLLADDKGLSRIGTGSPAAVATVVKRGQHKINYTTDVLDAGFPARWGAIEWTADGSVRLSTRSGNIKDPDRGWSDWQAVGPGKPAPVRSPDARYLQVMVEWPGGSRASLTGISIPYRVYNQPHYVDKVVVDSADQDGDKNATRPSVRQPGKNGAGDSDPGPHQTIRKIAWKVTNPDKDDLEYTLSFSPEKTDQWIPIKTDGPITKTKYDWETESLPDGWYRIKVVATDAPVNPPDEAITAAGVSDRFLLDNRPPLIKKLAVSGGKVSGKAVDAVSAISGIEFAIDGGNWIPAAPEDGILDSPAESFKFDLPADLAPGLHLVAVRAWDRALNINAAQVQYEKK
ncbi:MAG TPA: hypothetical protein VM658_20055 [bacterium]|nr:hypothetical protein [bacterium]